MLKTKTRETYRTLGGGAVTLDELTDDQRAFYDQARRFAAECSDDSRFANWWVKQILRLHPGLSRREVTEAPLYRILSDMENRMMIAAGAARPDDYRDLLAKVIRKRHKTRAAVCKELGIDPSYLSQVLNRKKNLSLPKLEELLWRLGYRLTFTPIGEPLELPQPREADDAQRETGRFSRLLGTLSPQEADEMQQLIEREFGRIEGDW